MRTLLFLTFISLSLCSPFDFIKTTFHNLQEKIEGRAGYYYAVDVSSAVTANGFSCLKGSGYETAFIRVYTPDNSGTVDPNAVANIKNAATVNMGVEIYVDPSLSGLKGAATQFDEMYYSLVQQGVTIQAIWLKVSKPISWPDIPDSNVNFITSYLTRAKQHGLGTGVFTNWYDWQQITGGYTKIQSLGNVRLWYWNANGIGVSAASSIDFLDFRPFGGFNTVLVKEYSLQASVCGYNVNQIIYPAASSKSKVSAVKNIKLNKSGAIVVGGIGL